MHYSLIAKIIITDALAMCEFLRVSHYNTTKEMWNTVHVIHEETTKVKRVWMNTLSHTYELFRMKSEKNIQDIEK